VEAQKEPPINFFSFLIFFPSKNICFKQVLQKYSLDSRSYENIALPLIGNVKNEVA
jgi:hypothetical protein